LRRLPIPAQGVQREIDFFGRTEPVGFYNTFAAYCDRDAFSTHLVPGLVEVCRNPATGEVHGLRGARLASVQFHPESVLTRHGPRILSEILTWLLGPADRVV
jgi:phenazine biosynthesis protein phzE